MHFAIPMVVYVVSIVILFCVGVGSFVWSMLLLAGRVEPKPKSLVGYLDGTYTPQAEPEPEDERERRTR